MTADRRVWQAVADETGAALVDGLDDLLAVLAYNQRYASVDGLPTRSVLVVGPGGGTSVLAADACDRAGLDLAAVDAGAEDELRAQGHGAGTSVANPVEIGIGPATPPPTLPAVITTILDRQPFSDVLVHVNVAAYYGYGTAGVAPLLPVIEQLGPPADRRSSSARRPRWGTSA